MHAYRTHNCAELRASDVGSTVRLSGWIHRKRDHGGVLFVDLARSLRAHPDRRRQRQSPALKLLDSLRVELVVTDRGRSGRARGRGGEPEAATGEIEVVAREVTVQSERRRAADAGRGRAGLSGGDSPQVPLPRSSPRAGARQHHASLVGDRLDPPPDDRPGLHRVPDADPDRQLARGRARLSGPEPRPSGQVLRASAGAADVQAADHGRGLRPLFPDRALLPRRGRPRRPLSPGEFYQLDFEMSFVTQDDVFNAIEPVLSGVFEEFADGAPSLRRANIRASRTSEAMLKYGSDKPDLRNPLLITDVGGAFQRLGIRPVRGARREGRGRPRGRCAGHGREEPQVLRRHERMGAGRGLRRPRLRHPQGRRMGRPDRQEPWRRGHEPHRRSDGPGPGRRHLLRRRQGRGSREASRAQRAPASASSSDLIEKGAFRFCWIVDFPMFEYQ